MSIVEEFQSCLFPEQRGLEKSSAKQFGEITLSVSELTLHFSDIRCDQKCLGLSANGSNILMYLFPSFFAAFHSMIVSFFYLFGLSYDIGIFWPFFFRVAANYFNFYCLEIYQFYARVKRVFSLFYVFALVLVF